MRLGGVAFASSSLLIVLTLPAIGTQFNPAFDPNDFDQGVQNQFFPLTPGMVWHYSSDDGETETAKVLGAAEGPCAYPKVIQGVSAFVVRDQVFDEGGQLIEDTCDWYAPDNDGNVWYLGEDATAFPGGSKQGSWEAGQNGAKPGIIMEAKPRRGDKYRQEFAPGVAEDVGQVIGLHKRVSVPAGEFEDCVQTLDSSRLAPGDREQKFYCPDVGLVLEVTPRGGRVRNELVP